MVPIYALNAWLAMRFNSAAIYLDTLRECYEAYVIYNFMAYLRNFLVMEYDLEATLEMRPQVQHIMPANWILPVWRNGRDFIHNCKHGVLQYTVVRPITTGISLICELAGVYKEGEFSATSAWTYLVFIDNISQIFALYCLALFYKACKEELSPISPLGKFLCIKAVIFATFWQSFLLQILVSTGLIPNKPDLYFYDASSIATGLQDFLICIEMMLAAVAHYYAFSHKPYVDLAAEPVPCCEAFFQMLNVSDVKADVYEHVRVVGGTVKRTIGRGPAAESGTMDERSGLLDTHANDYETSYIAIEEASNFIGDGQGRVVARRLDVGGLQDALSSDNEEPEDLSSDFQDRGRYSQC
ncbi:PREDICTED: transmembrane protein 184C-like isoform X2 [Priapulus caudatus]|nr:PREDICTED: transmembrane protein 184C-like isoform X2 [Priapulus caudatus]